MKKIYFTFFTVAAAITSVFAQTVPTCSLNPAFIASNKIGVFPDSATNFLSGTVGIPYEQNITVKVPYDTTASGITFCFNRFVLYTPTGVTNFNLPAGLMLGSSVAAVNTSTPGIFWFKGNSNSCASIFGTPTVAGSYTLSLAVDAYGTPFSTCSSAPTGGTKLSGQILNYYIINIAPAVGVRELENDRISLSQNFPNPASLTTDITFYVEGQDDATVTVYNMLGDVAAQQTVKTVVGENKVTIHTAELAAGTYMYTLKYKGASATKRMIVLNN
ncbi:MAG: T9SS type A sorting domain-containing protein [Bacteroidota bacterium]